MQPKATELKNLILFWIAVAVVLFYGAFLVTAHTHDVHHASIGANGTVCHTHFHVLNMNSGKCETIDSCTAPNNSTYAIDPNCAIYAHATEPDNDSG